MSAKPYFAAVGNWKKIGVAAVDSGQLMLVDPCYLIRQWQHGESEPMAKLFLHKDGSKFYCALHGAAPDPDARPFHNFEQPIASKFNATANQMIAAGDLVAQPNPEPTGQFSYAGCCAATNSEEQAGQLYFELGHAGAGVAFSSGYGDGCYDVWARYTDDDPEWGVRIAEVRIVMIDTEDAESAKEDMTTIFEMARLAAAHMSDKLVEDMDLSNEELARITQRINEHLG